MRISKHAAKRLQQRGLPRRVVDWLAAYGAIDHQNGSELFYFNRKGRQALKRDLGERVVKRHAKALDAYMICIEGRVATVGHRYQRVVRH